MRESSAMSGRRLFALIGTCAVGYLSIPFLVFACWFLDLFAKDYDEPLESRLGAVAAKAGLALLIATASGALALYTLWVLEWRRKSPIGLVPSIFLPWLPLATLFWCVYDLDWAVVYLASFALALILARPALVGCSFHASKPSAIAAALLTAALFSQSLIPHVRLCRYQAQLETGCWCCGYKQRALHELDAIGSRGREIAKAYLRSNANPGFMRGDPLLEQMMGTGRLNREAEQVDEPAGASRRPHHSTGTRRGGRLVRVVANGMKVAHRRRRLSMCYVAGAGDERSRPSQCLPVTALRVWVGSDADWRAGTEDH